MEKTKYLRILRKTAKVLSKPYEERRPERDADIDMEAEFALLYCAELIKKFCPSDLPKMSELKPAKRQRQ